MKYVSMVKIKQKKNKVYFQQDKGLEEKRIDT